MAKKIPNFSITKDEDDTCVNCHKPFTKANVKTPAGWKETKISGLCEVCFNEITEEPDEDWDGDLELDNEPQPY